MQCPSKAASLIELVDTGESLQLRGRFLSNYLLAKHLKTAKVEFSYSPLFSQEIGKKRLMYYRGSLRSGSLELGEKSWMISLSNDNADGNYSDLAKTSGQIGLNIDGSL